jgi:hypothetical protein
MKNRGGISIGARWVVFAVLFSPCIVRACSIVYPTVQVGRGFRVRVTDRGQPVRALRLVLSHPESPKSKRVVAVYSLTDADGYASFANLDPGSFLLTSDHDGGVADGVAVEVSLGGPANVTVPLKWPSLTPVPVRSMSGIVRGPDYYPSQEQVPLSLSLLEPMSARVIATTLSDSKGRFAFTDEVPAGIYFLRLNPSRLRGWSGEQMEGLITIEVSGKAKDDALDLDLGWSSCGLTYKQRQIYPEARLGRICGDIADIEGAAVSNAQVLLLASGEGAEVLEQTKSGVQGQFSIHERQEGTYKLLIIYPGFQPYLRWILFDATGSIEGCQEPIHVRLEVML